MLMQVILMRVSMTMEISMTAIMTKLTGITSVMLVEGRGEDLYL